jgi:hypothetical protein
VGFITPQPPKYDLAEHTASPYHERMRLSCVDWVQQGFGAPISAYLFYVLKIALYVGGWVFFVGRGTDAGITETYALPVAFAKAVVWTLVFEGMGFGSGSGPLTVRNLPPIAAIAHYLRPGTIRLAPFPQIPLTGGTKRRMVDVLGYLLHLVLVFRLLSATEITLELVLPIVLLLPLLGLRDKTIFLSARGEQYWTSMVVIAATVGTTPIGPDTAWGDVVLFLAGAKAIQLAIWWWAATSKLNRHFPSVVAVMLQNHVLNRSQALRRATVRDFPRDLRPSRLPTAMAHGGTGVEYLFPLLLVLGDGGPVTVVAAVVMVAFHAFIFSCFALGVPQEWNVLFIYSTIVLWTGDNALVKPWQLDNPIVWMTLLIVLLAVPAYGNLRPQHVSFLPSMRYYAGNWGTSTWLIKPHALALMEKRITKAAPDVIAQVERFFPADIVQVTVNRIAAFRAMHMHGRLVQRLIPRAVEDPDDYLIRDGELVAGVVLGWNFGDFHLHDEQLLAALHERCAFAPGDVRVVMIESQPFHDPRWHWRIVDAADGRLVEGHAPVAEAAEQQPWPDPIQGRGRWQSPWEDGDGTSANGVGTNGSRSRATGRAPAAAGVDPRP